MDYEAERVDISMRDMGRLRVIHEVLEGHLRQRQAAIPLVTRVLVTHLANEKLKNLYRLEVSTCAS